MLINLTKVKLVVSDESQSELRFLWCWCAIFKKTEGRTGSSVLPVEDGYGLNYHLINLLEHRINIDFFWAVVKKQDLSFDTRQQ